MGGRPVLGSNGGGAHCAILGDGETPVLWLDRSYLYELNRDDDSDHGVSCDGDSCDGLMDCDFSSDSRRCSLAASARLLRPFDRPGEGYV